MKSSRRLALRRETLTELRADELSFAGGAGAVPTLQAGCSYDDVTQAYEDALWRYSLHQHCSWTCI